MRKRPPSNRAVPVKRLPRKRPAKKTFRRFKAPEQEIPIFDVAKYDQKKQLVRTIQVGGAEFLQIL